MRKVQSYIANVSFPTSLDEMEELVNGEYYMDMEALLLFNDAKFTAPKWAAKGDIVFFYHAKSAITKIRHLKSLLKNESDKYKQVYDEIVEYLETAEEIYKKFLHLFFPPLFFWKRQPEGLHFRSRWTACY